MVMSICRRNVAGLFLYWFFHAFIPAYAIERLFFQSRGLGVTEVVLLEIVYGLAVVLLEVPMGVVADRCGRKPLMVAGAVATCGEFGLLLAARDFPLFQWAILMGACHKAMTSGTSNALLYDSLAAAGRTEQFVPLVARLRFMDVATTLCALVLGGWMAHRFGMECTYWVALASTVGSLLASLCLVEAPGLATRAEAPPLRQRILGPVSDSVELFRRHQPLARMLLYGAILGACLNYVDEFWQLYAQAAGVPMVHFGLLGAGCMMLPHTLSLRAQWLERTCGTHRLLVLCGALSVLGLGGLWLTASAWGLAWLAVIYLAQAPLEPILSGRLHALARSDFRATAESIQSLLQQLLTAIVGIGFGLAADHVGIRGGFGLLAVLVLVALGLRLQAAGVPGSAVHGAASAKMDP